MTTVLLLVAFTPVRVTVVPAETIWLMVTAWLYLTGLRWVYCDLARVYPQHRVLAALVGALWPVAVASALAVKGWRAWSRASQRAGRAIARYLTGEPDGAADTGRDPRGQGEDLS